MNKTITEKRKKGESQRVLRTTTSLSYMAIHRNERDRYCRKCNKK